MKLLFYSLALVSAQPVENDDLKLAIEEADFNLDIDSEDFLDLEDNFSEEYEYVYEDSESDNYNDVNYSYYDEYGNMLYYGNNINHEVVEIDKFYEYEYTIDENTGEKNYEYYYIEGEYEYIYEYVDVDDEDQEHSEDDDIPTFGFRSSKKQPKKGKKKVVKKVPKKKKKKKNGETRKEKQRRLKNTPLQIVKDSKNPFDKSNKDQNAENFFVDLIKNPTSYTESLKTLDEQIAEINNSFNSASSKGRFDDTDGLRMISDPLSELNDDVDEPEIYEAPPPKIAMDRKFQLRREELSPMELVEMNFDKEIHKNGAISTMHMVQALICRKYYPEAKNKDFKDCPVTLNQIRAVLRNYGCNCYSENFDNSPVKSNTEIKSWHMGSNGHGLDEVDNQCQRLHDSYRCIAIDTEQDLLEDPKKKYNENREDNCGIYVKFPYYINEKAKDINDLIKCNSPRNPDWSVRSADSIKCWQAACFIEREFAYKVYEIIGPKPETFFNDNILNFNVFTNKTICHHRPIRSNKKFGSSSSGNNNEGETQNKRDSNLSFNSNSQSGPIDASESNAFTETFGTFELASNQLQNTNRVKFSPETNAQTIQSMQQFLHKKPDPLHIYALAPGLHGKANACCGEYPRRLLYNDKMKVCENERILDINIVPGVF